MTIDPWALPIVFYSIIVKRDAVTRSFPGGVDEFERVHPPYCKNGKLFLLAQMSRQDTEYVLSKLNDAGVTPGQDVAVGGMTEGAILECPGVRFWTDDPDAFPGRWFSNVDGSVLSGITAPTFEPQVASAPIAPAAASEPRKGSPRRVVGSLIHYIYDDDCEDEECFDDAGPAVDRDAAKLPPGPTHTITLDYGYDCHSIEVDTETLEAIFSGECVHLDGQGFWYEEEGLCADRWHIDLANRCAGFTLDNCKQFDGFWLGLDGEEALIELGGAW